MTILNMALLSLTMTGAHTGVPKLQLWKGHYRRTEVVPLRILEASNVVPPWGLYLISKPKKTVPNPKRSDGGLRFPCCWLFSHSWRVRLISSTAAEHNKWFACSNSHTITGRWDKKPHVGYLDPLGSRFPSSV